VAGQRKLAIREDSLVVDNPTFNWDKDKTTQATQEESTQDNSSQDNSSQLSRSSTQLNSL